MTEGYATPLYLRKEIPRNHIFLRLAHLFTTKHPFEVQLPLAEIFACENFSRLV